jgi:hypothetical protein
MNYNAPPSYRPNGEETFGKELPKHEKAKEVVNNVYGRRAEKKQMNKYSGLRRDIKNEE